jgi:hypothetical protein
LVFKKNAFKKPTSFGCLGKIMNVWWFLDKEYDFSFSQHCVMGTNN